MPFVGLVMKTESGRQSDWAIKNQGFGPAINIYYTRYLGDDKPPMMQWMTPLARGEEYFLGRGASNLLTGTGFTVEYESLSGNKYQTFVKRTNGEMKTTFKGVTAVERKARKDRTETYKPSTSKPRVNQGCTNRKNQ
jgi:hypothetical protein